MTSQEPTNSDNTVPLHGEHRGEPDEESDDEDYYSEDCSTDDFTDSEDEEDEMQVLQLLSQQMQEIKAVNQQLKQTLLEQTKDRSSKELVESLMANRTAAKEKAEEK